MHTSSYSCRSRYPKGYLPAHSTPDGNCLFNAVSTTISGTEKLGTLLRLATVLQGVGHLEHYTSMVMNTLVHHATQSYTYWYFTQLKAELPDPDRLQQFICTVASSDDVFERRPKDHPTAEELIQYILKEEIQATARLGSYSGNNHNTRTTYNATLCMTLY